LNENFYLRALIFIWGRRFGDAARERRRPNAARTKDVPQTLNPTLFVGRVRDVTGDALRWSKYLKVRKFGCV
jgi:hypothetical protein